MQHLDLIDDIPKFGFHNRQITKQKVLSNDLVRGVLLKLDMSPAKRVCDDFGVCLGTVYKIRKNYALVNGILYRRIEDGSV